MTSLFYLIWSASSVMMPKLYGVKPMASATSLSPRGRGIGRGGNKKYSIHPPLTPPIKGGGFSLEYIQMDACIDPAFGGILQKRR